MINRFKVLLGFVLLLFTLNIQALTHDPNNTATIFVHGYSFDGYKQSGVFGED